MAYEAEVKVAKELYDYIFHDGGRFPVESTYMDFKHPSVSNPYLQEFVALGLTNANVIRILDEIPVSATELNENADDNVQKTLSETITLLYLKLVSIKSPKDVGSSNIPLTVIYFNKRLLGFLLVIYK